ncbi:MAG: NADH-quinone oxidoreductase subunit NuoE [Actinobacteria bacterium]|nr:NADH-quinone oxidoreductase subunit NuoE [Actinomycetota bacterium]
MDSIIKIIDKMNKSNEGLVPILQRVQDELGYLPIDILEAISEKMNLPYNQVFGVTTFYSQFRLEPQGENLIQLCDGTACHVKGSKKIIKTIEEKLGIKKGETTENMKFTFQAVYCIGSCGLSPTAMINKKVIPKLTSSKILKILEELS